MHDPTSEKPVDASSDASVSAYVPQAKPDLDMIVPQTYTSSKLRYLWIGIILFLVASVVIVGTVVIDSANKHEPSAIGNLLTPTPDTINPFAPTVTPTPDPTTLKKQYVNKTYGFRFTYPATWKYTEEASDEIVYPLLEVSLVPHSEGASGSIKVAIYNHGYDSVDEFVREDCREKIASCSATTIIAGRSGRSILNPPSKLAVAMVVFQNGKDIYQVQVEAANSQTEEANRKVFNDILESFIFDATPSAKPIR